MSAVVPEEVKPKFVKGTKRYGRRSRPDSQVDTALTCDSEDSPPSRAKAADSSPAGVRRAKLRRSTSLESVEVSQSDYVLLKSCVIHNCFSWFSDIYRDFPVSFFGFEMFTRPFLLHSLFSCSSRNMDCKDVQITE